MDEINFLRKKYFVTPDKMVCEVKDNFTFDEVVKLLREYTEYQASSHKQVVSGKQPDSEIIHAAAFEYATKMSTAPDKETPDWIIQDFKAGAQWALSQVACASGGVDTVAERGVKYCEWCQLETPIKDNKCSECGKPCAEVL